MEERALPAEFLDTLDLRDLEIRSTYEAAARLAKELASRSGTHTAVVRHGPLEWMVRADSATSAEYERPFVELHVRQLEQEFRESWRHSDDAIREIDDEIRAEILDAQDSYARSDEDGWFYES